MKKLTVNEQEELFAQDCKLINLRYEYSGFTGTEKWAIITELSEEALWDKYPDVISRYTPFILLSMAQGEVLSLIHISATTLYLHLWHRQSMLHLYSILSDTFLPYLK